MIVAPAGDGVRMRTQVLLGAGFALFVLLSHATFLKLPFYWDELGQFVPAALDIFRAGAWIPYSTVPNVHPPGVMAYLAAVWTVAGYSIAATRLAMLALAATGIVITLRLGVRLGLSWGAAVLAAGFLCISPLFFAQAMMAQLDMPAMVFFSLALLLFLNGRIVPAALACAVLVLVKETGIVAPALFGAWLWMERRRREALWFLLPVPPLLIWLIALERSTGHLFGNAAFTAYNLWYPLHPVRLSLALVRRLYYLFAGSGHCIGTAAVLLAMRRTKIFGTRAWRIASALVAAHVVLVSVLGGAVLERYLLPALPMLYIGFAAALWQSSVRWRVAGAAAILAALLTANFVNPPYPFPLENNLAFTDFVGLHAEAARYLEARFPDAIFATMFPLASELRRPDFGYVERPLHVREIYNFSAANVAPLARENVAVLVLCSEAWDPLGLMQNPQWTAFLRRYYEYEPPVSASQVRVLLGAQLVARWTRHGQWIEIYKR
jgi:4-amino-4-deoxy-L-arabinose transferase-like glycosyltransferase